MKLSIYMKSGSIITIRGVKDYEVKFRGNEITSLTIKNGWWPFGPKLIMGALDLSQIEAMVRS